MLKIIIGKMKKKLLIGLLTNICLMMSATAQAQPYINVNNELPTFSTKIISSFLPLEPFTNKFDIVVSDNFSYEELQQRNGKLFVEVGLAMKDYAGDDGHMLSDFSYVALDSTKYCWGDIVEVVSVYNPLNNVPDDCVVLRSEKIRNVYNVEKWSEENGRYGVLD